MTMEEAQEILQEIKHYLTAGNPVWDVDEIAEACDMAIEALRNEINCVKCEHYTERETYTGIKGVCKMDTAHREDLISRSRAIKEISEWATDILHPKNLIKEDAIGILESLPSADAAEVVRCKDCRWWNGNTETMHNNHLCRNWSKFGSIGTGADDFCSYGERREP